MNSKPSRCLWLLTAVVLLAGCGTPRQGPGEVAKKWSCKLREMQIQPIFPPREDVHVGDVYWLPNAAKEKSPPTGVADGVSVAQAYCNWEGDRDFMKIGSHLAHIAEVGPALVKHYQNRPSLPEVGTSTISISGSGSGSIEITASPRRTTPQAGTALFTLGMANRTRVVAFPDFLSIDVSQAAIGAAGTASGLPFGLGASSQASDAVRISIPVTESYGLPVLPLMAAVTLSMRSTDTSSLCSPQAASLGAVFRDNKTGAIHVVQEVYYARAIDVEMQEQQARGFGVGLNTDFGTQTIPSMATGSQSTATSSIPSTTATQAMADAAVKAAMDLLGLRNGLPGVTITRSSASNRGIVMRRLFDHPVAIGMRSVQLPAETDMNAACLVATKLINAGSMAVLSDPGSAVSAPVPATIGKPDGRGQ